MNKSRQSNFELMRIVSMFFIALWHFLLFGKVLERTSGITQVITTVLAALLLVHVNSYVMLTGYFNYDKKFKLSKVIKTNNSMWFYRATIIILLTVIFGISYSKFYTIKMLSPLSRFHDYWFLVVYMILYLISPLLNIVIKNIDKNKHKMVIIGLFIISLLAYATSNEFYNINGGYSLFSFILLYFIGSYLHKYPIEGKKSKIIILSILGFILFGVLNVILYKLGYNHLDSHRESVRYYAKVIDNGFTAYSNPFIILGTICYFVFFSKLNISNKVINFFGKYCLGVYLITQNSLIYKRMYKPLGFSLKSYNYKHVLIAIGYSILIVIICSLIEALRSYIFKFIYDRKVSCKLREKITIFFKKYKINW